MAKLPNADLCFVAERKITNYLLDVANENGKHKARFFLAFGFTIEEWQVMAAALKQHAAAHEVTSMVARETFGTNYVIEGPLMTPDGRNPQVRVIWAIDRDDTVPRLISAYPL